MIAFTSQSLAQTKFGKVFYLKGDVQVDREGVLTKLNQNDEVLHQDIVKVADGGILILSFGKDLKSKMKFTEGTSALIQQVKGEKKVTNSVAIGIGNMVVDFFNEGKEQEMIIKTANASLGVRGTKFFTMSEKNGDFAMSVKEGVVEVASNRSDENAAEIKSGEGTVLNGKKEIIPAQKVDWNDDVNWRLDPAKGKLTHSQKFFKKVRGSFKRYRKFTAAKMKRRRKMIRDKRQGMRERMRKKSRRMLKRKMNKRRKQQAGDQPPPPPSN